MLLEGRSRNINARRRSRSALIFVAARQQMCSSAIIYRPEMPNDVPPCLRVFIRRPIFIPPLLILINLFLIIRYGIPVFEHDTDGEFQPALVTADRVANQQRRAWRTNEERLENISKICERYNKEVTFRELDMSGTALATPDKNIFYCFVPKVGCTYWKRVMRFISKDYRGRYKSPENIPRIYTHFGPYVKTQVIHLRNFSTPAVLDYKLKFMFTRDPYERLWSGYLDKLYLPDFWWWLGTKIVNETRPNADARSLKCGDDVTFEELLRYTTSKLIHGERVNNHFTPVYTQCNPCQINFDVIGKLESFLDDSELVLRSANISLDNQSNNYVKDTATEEVETLIKYNFDIIDGLKEKGAHSDCYNPLTVAKRLWKTFQYHGYISDIDEFPIKEEDIVVADVTVLRKSLLKRIVHLRNSAGFRTELWKSQRQKYLTKAYRSVSLKVFKAIGRAYKGDLELFGYNKRNWPLS